MDKQDNGYVHWELEYDVGSQRLEVERYRTNEWLQYDSQVDMYCIVGRIQFNKTMELPLLRGHEYIKFTIQSSGAKINYAVKDATKYMVDLNGSANQVNNEELPVEGYWMNVCGLESSESKECMNRIALLYE